MKPNLLFLSIFWSLGGAKKVILDCDPGIDDAFALQFLLNEPTVQLIAITT